MQASFMINAAPTGKARPRVTSHGTYTPKKTRDYERLVQIEYKRQCNGMYFGNEPIAVEITANFSIPKSKPKKARVAMLAGEIRPTVKPDSDNIAKAVCDALNGVAWHDDSQIVTLAVEKWYIPGSEHVPSVIVRIREV